MLKCYWHTIKYLRFIQLYYQFYYRIKKKIKIKKLIPQEMSLWQASWQHPDFLNISISDSLEFFALNTHDLIDDITIWNSKKHSKLWLYNLHYFAAIKNDNRHDIYANYIELWIKNNPPIIGVGWEPYTISLRAVNWIKYFSESGCYKPEWLISLNIQAEVLVKKIEYHILANHILANAKALVFLGVYFKGVRATFWLKKGLQILHKEVKEQFLEDGGHFELSPMYHAIVLWDICELINLANKSQNEHLLPHLDSWKTIVKNGLTWLALLSHPDGDIAFFMAA